MNNSDVDLNIENYNNNELLQLFNLDKNNTIREINTYFDSLKNKSKINTNLYTFLHNARNKLIQSIHISSSSSSSSSSYNSDLTTEHQLLHQPNTLAGGAHEVIIPKQLPVVNVFNNPFPSGALNPVERKTITKVICIDTLFRNNYLITKSTDFSTILPDPIYNVISMRLISLDFPNMWHAFSSEICNNIFVIYTYNITGLPDTKHIITIPDGNYSSAGLTTSLNNLFSNMKQGLEFLYAEVNEFTSKTLFRAKDFGDSGLPFYPYDPNNVQYSPNFYFKLIFDVNPKSLFKNAGWMLGFRKKEYSVSIDNFCVDGISYENKMITYKGLIESESSYGNAINDYIFFEVNDFNKNFTTNTLTSLLMSDNSYIGNNILARITINNSYYHIINNNVGDNVFKQRDYFGPVNIEKLSFRMLNKYGDVINLLENNYSFALEFTTLYSV